MDVSAGSRRGKPLRAPLGACAAAAAYGDAHQEHALSLSLTLTLTLSLTLARYCYSLVFITVALVTRGEQGRDNEQFETAAMLITFILLGKWLEALAKGKASRAVSQLLSMVPPTALQLETCKDIETEPHEVPVAGLLRGRVRVQGS